MQALNFHGRVLILLLTIIALLVLFYLSGPRVSVNPEIKAFELPDEPMRIEDHLRRVESRYDDMIDGAEKTIVWADAHHKKKTDYAIVYLHGFSASRQETAPLADNIAATLGANLYYNRLTGHGRGPDAYRGVTTNDWLNDAAESVEVGRRLGHKVILIGLSTGGTLAMWLAANERYRSELAAMINISTNFMPNHPLAPVVLWPWGKQITRLLEGDYRTFPSQNDLHEKFWSSRYHTDAVMAVMGLVGHVNQLDYARITTPSLVIYNENDTIVDPRRIPRAYRDIGAEYKKIVVYNRSEDERQHVLAGDILSPSTTQDIERIVLDFVRPVVGR